MANRAFALAFWLALAFATYSAFVPQGFMATPKVSDVALHGVAFAVLTLLLQLAYLARSPLRTVLLMALYGVFIELVQLQLPSRQAELKDLLVDGMGILIGLLLFRLLGAQIRAIAERVL